MRFDFWLAVAGLMFVAAVLFIALPNGALVWSSFHRDGGSVTLHHSGQGLAVSAIDAGALGAQDRGPDRVDVSIGGTAVLTVTAKNPSAIALESDSGPIEARVVDANRMVIAAGGHGFRLAQQTQLRIFGQGPAFVPLAIASFRDGRLVILHSPDAFLTVDSEDSVATDANYRQFFADERYREALINSLLFATLATLLAAIPAVALAYLFARYELPGREAIVLMMTVAAVAPPFLGAAAWRILFGRSGIITDALGLEWSILGWHGILFVKVWLLLPVIFLMSHTAFKALDAALIEASYGLSSPRWRTFLKVEMPLAAPGMLTGAYLAFASSLADFGTPRIIGLDVNVLPTVVYDAFVSEAGAEPAVAGARAVLLVILSSLAIAAHRAYLAARSFAVAAAGRSLVLPAGRTLRRLSLTFGALVLAICLVPHVTVATSSFFVWRSGVMTLEPTLANHAAILAEGTAPVLVSLSLGLTATLCCGVFGAAIAYLMVRRRITLLSPALGALVMTPYVVPGTVIGIGLVAMFNEQPLILTGTWIILFIAFTVRHLPYAVKACEASLYRLHPAQEEAALGLGATPFLAFRSIIVPALMPGLVTGASLAFLHTMTELSSTIVLFRPPWKPITAVIFENAVTTGADFGFAAALATLLMVIIYIPLWLVYRARRRLGGFDAGGF